MESQVLGFIGLGHMGGPMASRLMDAGHSLCVFDTNADALRPLVARGATAGASPKEVASAAPIVLMSLPTPNIVQAVALGEGGIIHGAGARMLIDLSTTGPGMATVVARGVNERGIVYLGDGSWGKIRPPKSPQQRPYLAVTDESYHLSVHRIEGKERSHVALADTGRVVDVYVTTKRSHRRAT